MPEFRFCFVLVLIYYGKKCHWPIVIYIHHQTTEYVCIMLADLLIILQGPQDSCETGRLV